MSYVARAEIRNDETTYSVVETTWSWPAAVAPVPITPPSVSGVTVPAEILTATPGVWPDGILVNRTWRRGAVTVAADVLSYTLTAADAGQVVVYRETPVGWLTFVDTLPQFVQYDAPATSGTISNVSVNQGSATVSIAGATFFTGEAITYSGTGPIAVDPVTGAITIATATVRTAEAASIIAQNGTGIATQAFTVTIIDQGVVTPVKPPALNTADVEITWRLDPEAGTNGVPAGAYTWHFTLTSPPAGMTRLAWKGNAHVAGHSPVTTGYHPCVAHPTLANTWYARRAGTNFAVAQADWLWVNLTSPTTVGQSKTHHLIYSTETIAVMPGVETDWSEPTAAITQTVALFVSPSSNTYSTLSKRMPMVLASEWGVPDYLVGDGMQYIHAMTGCYAKMLQPLVMYMTQDSGATWKSLDGGLTWGPCWDIGLFSYQGLGIERDPVNPDRVFATMGGDSRNPINAGKEGFYASYNGGRNWTRKRATNIGASRAGHQAITWAPGSIGATRAEKWLAIVDGRPGDDVARTNIPIIRSINGGDDWTDAGVWDQVAYGQSVWMVGDPRSDNRFIVSANKFLVLINNAFTTPTFTKMSGANGLPNAAPSGPAYVSDDGLTIIVGFSGHGIYQSTTGYNGTFTRISTETGFARFFVNPYNPDQWSFTYSENYTPSLPKYSLNRGATVIRPPAASIQRRPGQTYTVSMEHQFSGVAYFDAAGSCFSNKKQKGYPQAANYYRSSNGGVTWQLSNGGFSGHNVATSGHQPFMFSRVDKLKWIFPLIDIGIRLTLSGGKWVESSTLTSSLVGEHNTVKGAAVYPTAARNHLFAAVGKSNGTLWVSLNGGATWVNRVPSRSSARAIIFDTVDPKNVMWGRHRSVNHGEDWALMTGLGSNDGVLTCTLGAAGAQRFYALDIGGDVRTVKISDNAGASWTTHMVLPVTNRVIGDRFGIFAAHPTDKNILYTSGPTDSAGNRPHVRQWNVSAKTFVDKSIFGAGSPPAGGPHYINGFAQDPRFPLVMYVTLSYPGSTRLYRTTDGGENWTPLGGEYFPTCCNINSLNVHPLDGFVMIGGSNGTFFIAPPYVQENSIFDTIPHPSYLQAA